MSSIVPPCVLMILSRLVLQLGFVIREVGAVCISDTKRIIIRHFVNLLISGVVNCSLGFVLASSDGGVADKFVGKNIYYDPNTFWDYVFGLQWIIATITSSIVAGAVAERCRLIAYFIYTVFITGFIHPVVRHWTLNKRGWLDDANISYQDDAGSGAVHVLGGIAALIGAMMIGPRTGRFEPSLKKDFNDRCHSVPIAVSGGILLLIGFVGFIWGYREPFSVYHNRQFTEVFLTNPFVSSFIAAFTSLLINRYFGKKWSLFVAINGALTGMIAISAGNDFFEPYAAATIGLNAAIVYRAYSVLLVRFGIDDPLDVVSVHFGGGSWGLIAVAFFHRSKGLLHTWNSQSALDLQTQYMNLETLRQKT